MFDAYLQINKYVNILSDGKIEFKDSEILFYNHNCLIVNNDIYYFYCKNFDVIRFFLVIFYFIIKYKINIINNNEFDIEGKYKLLNSNCIKMIKYIYNLYYDKETMNDIEINYETYLTDNYYNNKYLMSKKCLQLLLYEIINNIENIDYIISKMSGNYNDIIKLADEIREAEYNRYKYLKYKLKFLKNK
jgi:hypothetical protein